MVVAEDILCSRTHEYVLYKNGYYYIGLTDYFIENIEEIVFLELPEIDTEFVKGEPFGRIQGINSSKDLYMPVSGKVVEINEEIVDNYDNIKEKSWLIKIKSETAVSDSIDLFDYDDYLDLV